MAEDALAIMLGAYVEQRKDIPVPSEPTAGQGLVPAPPPPPPIIAAKLDLYTAIRSQRISNVALGERLGIGESAVSKLQMKSRVPEVGVIHPLAPSCVGYATHTRCPPCKCLRLD